VDTSVSELEELVEVKAISEKLVGPSSVWKCKATKHQDNRNREAPRRTVPVDSMESSGSIVNITIYRFKSISFKSSGSICSKSLLSNYSLLDTLSKKE
nr:hypothetical protein [Tanacetum cinerariifolium]